MIKIHKLEDCDIIKILPMIDKDIEDVRFTELKLTSVYDSAFDSIIIFNDKVTKILVYNELLESSISEYKSHLRDEKLKQIGI